MKKILFVLAMFSLAVLGCEQQGAGKKGMKKKGKEKTGRTEKKKSEDLKPEPEPAVEKGTEPEPAAQPSEEDEEFNLLLDELQSGDMESRREAAIAVCKMGQLDEKLVPRVKALLESEDPETREAIAYSLG